MSNIINPHRFAAAGVSESDILAMSPYMWLDADAAYVEEAADDLVEADADNVVYWRDRSGNDYDFFGYSAGYYPHWYSNGTNSKPYVHFDADRLRIIPSEVFTTPGTLYFVISFDTITQSGKTLLLANKTLTTLQGGSWPNAFRSYWGSDNAAGNVWYYVQSTDTQILQMLAGGASAGGGIDPIFRKDGGADEGVDLFDGDGADVNLFNVSGTYYLGFGLAFKLYEFIMIPDITHTQDDVFSYLGDKYDITVTAVS